jgi:hypothetical protein
VLLRSLYWESPISSAVPTKTSEVSPGTVILRGKDFAASLRPEAPKAGGFSVRCAPMPWSYVEAITARNDYCSNGSASRHRVSMKITNGSARSSSASRLYQNT